VPAFDLEIIGLMKKALDDALASLPPEIPTTTLKTTLALRILESAAEGERDCERLRNAALGTSSPHWPQLPLLLGWGTQNNFVAFRQRSREIAYLSTDEKIDDTQV